MRRLLAHPAFPVVHRFWLQGGNRLVLRNQVKEAFRRNQHETDLQKIQEHKDA
jgi:hypothetical protein